MKHVVVIGGGLGGLAVALRLRARGFAVTVFEAGPTFGGKMNRWESQGFTFDTGPSLITMPWVFEDLFRARVAVCRTMWNCCRFIRFPSTCTTMARDFTYTSDLPQWLKTLKQLEPRDVDGFFRFQELGREAI